MKKTLHNYILESHIDLRQMTQQKKTIEKYEKTIKKYEENGDISTLENALKELRRYRKIDSYKVLPASLGRVLVKIKKLLKL